MTERLWKECVGIKETAARVRAEREKERAQKALDQVARQAYRGAIQTAKANLKAANYSHVRAILDETDSQAAIDQEADDGEDE